MAKAQVSSIDPAMGENSDDWERFRYPWLDLYLAENFIWIGSLAFALVVATIFCLVVIQPHTLALFALIILIASLSTVGCLTLSGLAYRAEKKMVPNVNKALIDYLNEIKSHNTNLSKKSFISLAHLLGRTDLVEFVHYTLDKTETLTQSDMNLIYEALLRK